MSFPINSTYISRDNTPWHTTPIPAVGRLRSHNILRKGYVGPVPNTINNHVAIFKSIMSPEIIDIIVDETNRKARESLHDWAATNSTEIYAFFGLIIFAGVYNANKHPVKELWAPYNFAIYKGTMSKIRFQNLTRFIRFDNGATRAERLKTSKSAAIDKVWNMLITNLERNYVPHSNLTVDEQLFGYHGRTRFTQFIPSKPDKYGIKVWWICDARSHYPLKGIIYTGKLDGAERATNQGENIVLKLAEKYVRSGRTIYADNFFSSLTLAKNLISLGLAYVGTVRSNKRFVPDEMRWNKARQLNSTLFCRYENDVSLCSYAARKNRVVLLMSTEHYNDEIDCTSQASKPQQIMDYNVNKGGVDVMDQMVSGYSCKRSTNRWPLAMFFNMLDVAALAACIIHDELNNTSRSDKRRSFIVELCRQLVVPQMIVRANDPTIARFSYIREAWRAYGVVVSGYR